MPTSGWEAQMSGTATLEPATLSKGERYFALAAMVFVTSVTFIDMTIVTIASPDIEKELGISDEALQWVINGYLLGLAATFALFGRVADVVGHKRMAIIGTLVFVIASTLCGFTPVGDISTVWIIGFRVIQGMGAAMLFPAALAIVVASFGVGERGRALAIFFAVTGGFTAIGPLAGGYLTEWTWRAIFWVNVPIAIIAIILTAFIKTTLPRKQEPIDWGGAVLIIIGMAVSIIGLQQAGSWGWLSPWTIGCIIVGLIFIAIFVKYEFGQEYPIIRMRIFADRAFVADNAVLFFAMMTFVAVFFFLSMYAQAVLGESTSDSGLFLMWYFVGFIIAAQVGGAMLDRVGSKLPMILGTIVAAVGYGVWAYQSTQMTSSAIVPWIVVSGAGVGLLLGPASTDAVNRAIDASYGEVTGITQTIRNYGSALGMAILGSIMLSQFTSRITDSLLGFGFSQEQADTLAQSASNLSSGGIGGFMANIPPQDQSEVLSSMQTDLAQSIQIITYGMAVMMILALLMAFLHPGGKVVSPEEEQKTVAEGADQNSAGALIKKLVIMALIAGAIFAFFWFI